MHIFSPALLESGNNSKEQEQLNAIVMVNMLAFTDQVRGVLWSGAVAAPDRDAS